MHDAIDKLTEFQAFEAVRSQGPTQPGAITHQLPTASADRQRRPLVRNSPTARNRNPAVSALSPLLQSPSTRAPHTNALARR